MHELPPSFRSRIASWMATAPERRTLSAFALFETIGRDTGVRSGPGAEPALEMARLAFEGGLVGPALEAVREACETGPSRGEAALTLCILLLRQRDPEAVSQLRHCLDAVAEPSPSWSVLGDMLLAEGQQAAALVCLARGVMDGPLALRCGIVARDLGRRAEALSWFRDAARFAPGSQRVWFLFGTAAQDERLFDLAASAYRKVLELNPTSAEAALNLGIVLQENGDLDGAKEAYRRAVKSRPDVFGRIVQALAGSARGELWLDVDALRRDLADRARPPVPELPAINARFAQKRVPGDLVGASLVRIEGPAIQVQRLARHREALGDRRPAHQHPFEARREPDGGEQDPDIEEPVGIHDAGQGAEREIIPIDGMRGEERPARIERDGPEGNELDDDGAAGERRADDLLGSEEGEG